MIYLNASSAPPAVGVNTNVTLTLALPITRSALAIENELKLTAPPIPPEARALEGFGSALVDTVTRPPAVGSLLSETPDSVMVTETPALMVEPAVAILKDVSLGAPMAVRMQLAVEIEPVGVVLLAKNFDGYINEITLPAASAPPAVGVNQNVTPAVVLPITRSASAI